MLWLQAGPGPARADVAQMKPTAGEERQAQAGAQDLPAALAERAIDLQKGHTHVLKDTRWGAQVHGETPRADQPACKASGGACPLPNPTPSCSTPASFAS